MLHQNVRFTPNSGHTAGCTKCPLSAKSRHPDHHDPDLPPEALVEVIACRGPLSGSLGDHHDRVDHAMIEGTLTLGLVRL